MKNFFKNQDGMGSVETLIIMAIIIIIAVFLFRPFVPQLLEWVKGFFSNYERHT